MLFSSSSFFTPITEPGWGVITGLQSTRGRATPGHHPATKMPRFAFLSDARDLLVPPQGDFVRHIKQISDKGFFVSVIELERIAGTYDSS